MEYRRQAQAIYYTRYHLVFVTKYRRHVLKHHMGAYCIGIFHRICKNYPDLVLLEANTDVDHAHLLMSIPPKWSISKAINILKSNSSRVMQKKFPAVETMYGKKIAFWSDGYFLSTVGANEQQIKAYIEHQGKEESGQAKLVL